MKFTAPFTIASALAVTATAATCPYPDSPLYSSGSLYCGFYLEKPVGLGSPSTYPKPEVGDQWGAVYYCLPGAPNPLLVQGCPNGCSQPNSVSDVAHCN